MLYRIKNRRLYDCFIFACADDYLAARERLAAKCCRALEHCFTVVLPDNRLLLIARGFVFSVFGELVLCEYSRRVRLPPLLCAYLIEALSV